MLNRQYFSQKSRQFFHAIDVPNNLSAITNIDEKNEVETETSGLSCAKINRIWQSVESLYKTGTHPGIAFCLRYKGHVVLNRAIGYAQGADPANPSDDKSPMLTETPTCLFSASKAIMAILVHKLAEEGHINLLNPVAQYIPEFGILGKDKISIYQMLAHRGGFPIVKESPEMEGVNDRQKALDAIYNTPSNSPDGRIQAYHAVTSGFIADELIRRTAGCTINEYLHEKISRPMGMKYFHFGLEKQHRDKVAHNYVTGINNPGFVKNLLKNALGVSLEDATHLSNQGNFMDAVIPSGNLYATAEEAARFYQMLLEDGQYQGQSILKPETVKIAIKEAGKTRLDKGIFLPLRFSAGFMLGGNPVGIYGKNSDNAFGHLGFSNIFCWADPDRDIAVSIISTGKPVLGNHILALPKLVHSISKECLST